MYGSMQTHADNRAFEAPRSAGRLGFGMANTDVSASKLRGLDIMAAIVAIVMLLGPLAVGATGVH
jgi:hypothetical protein